MNKRTAYLTTFVLVLGTCFVGCSGSDEQLSASIDRLGDRIASIERESRKAIEHEGLAGPAGTISVEYMDGTNVTMTAGDGDYSEFQSFYVYVKSNHFVIHLSKPGEARNSAESRKLVPFSAIRSVIRTPENAEQ